MADEESSVRVAVRIRPQIAREVIDSCRVCTSVTVGEPQVTLGSDKSFTYDFVFDMGVDQTSIFQTCVEELVDSSLDGYNATVLAYGQTGSGKTYTMGTGFDVEIEEHEVGIIPRAINHLFDGITDRALKARESGNPAPEFKVVCQFLELYNEDVIDLFNPNETYYGKHGRKGIKIHENPEGGIYLVGVTTKAVHSAEEALQCLRLGALSRTTASTQMNSQSSRSHAIFTLYIKQERIVKVEGNDEYLNGQPGTGAPNECEMLTAKFHFVDLAGSERLKRTGATGERAREGISINCGLLALGNVISALGDKSKKAFHVPYRDSKLTRLLQDSLGGNSKTVMIACVSPSDRDFMETLNTLKYANRARNIRNKIMINQDKSSRTIMLLRAEIQQLQLELQEYKQGKRVVGDDGEETVNDMFHENTMLQSEISNLRTRVKAMQDTIEALTQKNTLLLAEKATGTWINSGSDSDVTEMIQQYLSEIEELRVKLLESEALCKQLRKQNQIRASLSPRAAMTGSFGLSINESSTNGLLELARKDLRKDLELLATKGRPPGPSERASGGDVDHNATDAAEGAAEGVESESEDEGEESDSDTDSEEKQTSRQITVELAELTTEIDVKQRLIEELEMSQRRLDCMKQHYEEKLSQLQTRIKATQEERDKVLASLSGQQNQTSDKAKKIRDEYERKLANMQKEVKRLQSAQKEHARLIRNQSQHETALKQLKADLAEMKRTKVKLVNQMKEENQRHKESEVRRNREIAQLRKESRRHENQIRSLEAEKRQKEVVLKRKQEEVTALRKLAKPGLSKKAAGRVGVRHAQKAFSPKVAKQRWQSIEKNINKISLNKRTVAAMERDMERLLNEREQLTKTLTAKRRKRDAAKHAGQDPAIIKELNDDIEDIQANIDYIQESITEAQNGIMQIEESKESFDTLDIASITMNVDLQEASYLMEKLYNMAINQSYIAAQKELAVKEVEAREKDLQQTCHLQEQLLQHMYRNNELEALGKMATSTNSTNGSGPGQASSSSSTASSRSSSPVSNLNGNSRSGSTSSAANKIRRRTALPEELLYPPDPDADTSTGIPLGHSQSASTVRGTGTSSCVSPWVGTSGTLSPSPPPGDLPSHFAVPLPPKGIVRVPSAPGSLRNLGIKPDIIKPSPVLSRKTYDRQDSTSPRVNRRTFVIGAGNLIGKPGSMEQDLDKSPPGSPPSFRRLNSRERDRDINVFSRLTSSTMQNSEQQVDQGVITPFQGKISVKSPLVCTHIAEGHKSAVLSMFATEDLLFTSSKDLTVKVWDLHQGRETVSLTGHPKNVVAVKFDEHRKLVFSVSSAYIKVWDLRTPVCVKTLSSSGLSTNGPLAFTNSVRALQIPPGESQINDIALNHSGTILYAAAGDRVGVWDVRTFTELAKLNGGHQAAVTCLAVGRISEDEDVVITGSRDHYIKVFEVLGQNEGVLTPKVKLDPPHYDGVQSLAMRGGTLFSGSRDSCIKKWDLSKPELVQSLNNAHKDWVLGLALLPGSPLLLSGCRGGVLKLWNADICSLLGEMKAHSGAINAVSTNSSLIFSASSDSSIRFWKLNSRFDTSPDLIET